MVRVVLPSASVPTGPAWHAGGDRLSREAQRMPRQQHGDRDFDDDFAAPFGGASDRDAARPDQASPLSGTRAFPAEDVEPSAPGRGFEARLRVEHGSVDARELPLERPIHVIGRRLTCDVVIHDTNVSRQHARLLRRGGGYAIEDTQSSNGTFVNEERIFGARLLLRGDVIRIGDSVFVYEYEEPAELEHDEPPAGLGGTIYQSALAEADEDEPPDADVQDAPAVSTVGTFATSAPDAPVAESVEEPIPVEQGDESHPAPSGAARAEDVEGTEGAEGAEGGPVAPAAAGEPSATRTALSDVRRDLASLVADASRVAARVRQLEDTLAATSQGAGGRLDRGAPDDAVALIEFRRLLSDLQEVGDPEAATAAASLLDQLREHPRDIELLLSISKQAPIMAVVLRQHAYLMRLAPLLDEALGRVLD